MKINYFTLTVFILFGLFLNTADAQKYDIKKYSTNEGLPSGQIGDVVQDTEGYIWLATYSGLIRFDGTDYKTFGTEQGLRNTYIYDLFIDVNDKLWVSTQNSGVSYLKGDSAYYPPELDMLDSLMVTYITQSEDGKMWFSTYGNGLYSWDGNRIEVLNTENGLPSDTIWNVHFRSNGEVWIATIKGVGIYDGDEIKVINERNGLSGASAFSITERENGEMWIATSSGITIFDDGEWKHLTSIDNKELEYVYVVLADEKGRVWVATEQDGMYLYEDGEYTHFTKKNGLSSNYIYNLSADNTGNIWIATDENGVNVFRNESISVFNGSEFTSGEVVSVIYEANGEIWIGTENGITLFNEEGRSKHFLLPDRLVKYKEVWDIEKLPNGNLLVLNSNSRLLEFDGNNFRDFNKTIGLTNEHIHDMLIDGDVFWFATESGLMRYRNGEFSTFGKSDGLESNYVWVLYKDTNNDIWAITEFGFSRIKEDSIQTFTVADGFNSNSFLQVTEDSDGHYWVVTDNGFTKMILENETSAPQLTHYWISDAYLQDIQFLQFDNSGNLWIGTSGGLHFLNEELFNESDGGEIEGIFMPVQDYGQGVEFSYLGSIIDSDENLWFGTYSQGLIKFEAGNFPEYKNPPVPFLRNLKINGQDFDHIDDYSKDLRYNENNVAFYFGAFNYTYPNRVFYRYRLSGFEDNWNTVYNKSVVNYTNLPAGDYLFQIQTKSVDSDWGVVTELVGFSIKKPFWKSWWFLLMAAAACGLVIYFLVRFVMMQYQKKKLADMVEERTADLNKALEEKEVLIKEVHHRVKNNMAIVSGLLELQGYKTKDEEARAAIEDSKLRIQTMSSIHEKLYQSNTLTDIDFKGFAEDLIHRISASMKGDDQKIELHLDIKSGELNVSTAIPCGLILNELITNCYEHAFKEKNEGNIWVSFRPYIGNRYRLEVKDDGVGISEEVIVKKRTSLGVTLIHSLTSQIKGDIEILNDEGTSVIIKIPREQ